MNVNRVLFVQGAGDGAHAEGEALVADLANALGPAYPLRYPGFSGLEHLAYDSWRGELAAELAAGGHPDLVVAHSLGGAAVLKFLSQEGIDLPLAGLFLIATPYKCKDGEWGSDDFALDLDFASTLPRIGAVFLYHSEDDEWVPFAHLAQWAKRLPGSTVRPFTDRGHAFSAAGFPELVDDIRATRRR